MLIINAHQLTERDRSIVLAVARLDRGETIGLEGQQKALLQAEHERLLSFFG